MSDFGAAWRTNARHAAPKSVIIFECDIVKLLSPSQNYFLFRQVGHLGAFHAQQLRQSSPQGSAVIPGNLDLPKAHRLLVAFAAGDDHIAGLRQADREAQRLTPVRNSPESAAFLTRSALRTGSHLRQDYSPKTQCAGPRR
jgi:hypothetical protein